MAGANHPVSACRFCSPQTSRLILSLSATPQWKVCTSGQHGIPGHAFDRKARQRSSHSQNVTVRNPQGRAARAKPPIPLKRSTCVRSFISLPAPSSTAPQSQLWSAHSLLFPRFRVQQLGSATVAFPLPVVMRSARAPELVRSDSLVYKRGGAFLAATVAPMRSARRVVFRWFACAHCSPAAVGQRTHAFHRRLVCLVASAHRLLDAAKRHQSRLALRKLLHERGQDFREGRM